MRATILLFVSLMCCAVSASVMFASQREWPGVVRHPTGSSASMDVAEKFVRLTYPELMTTPNLRYMAATHGSWADKQWTYELIQVQVDAKDVKPIRTSEELAATLLHVMLQFDSRGLHSVLANGRHVFEEQQNVVIHDLSSNGPWTLDRVQARLRDAGATYINDEQAIRSRLPLKQWEPVFGTVQVGKGRLATSDHVVPGWDGPIGGWIFTMTASHPAHATYDVSVEPFGGRVIGIARTN